MWWLWHPEKLYRHPIYINYYYVGEMIKKPHTFTFNNFHFFSVE